MATIAENLLALQTAKENIKTAIESKGQDLTDVPFTEYSNKINAITTSDKPDMLQARVDATNSCAYLFCYYMGDNVDFASGLDTSKVTTMSNMFSNSKVRTVPLFDTSQVENMGSMFYLCSYLEEVPKFDTKNVTSISSMFYGCTALTNIPQLDTSKVTSLFSTFDNCTRLIEVPQMNTSNVTTMYRAFCACKALKEIPYIDTSKVTNMNQTFGACEQITTIPALDTSSVTNMTYMFQECTSLISIPQLNTSKVTTMQNMFSKCYALTTIPALDTRQVKSFMQAFFNCTGLTAIEGLDMQSVTSVSQMFNNCTNLTNLTLTNIKINLQIGSGTSWGHLLTLDSLTNTIKELWDKTGSTTQTLTVGSANLEKLANVYVKLIDITDEMRAEDEYIDNKKPFEVCESTDEGAMTIQEYVTSKNWQLA